MQTSIIQELHEKIAILEKENRGLEDRCIQLEGAKNIIEQAAINDRAYYCRQREKLYTQAQLWQGKFHTLRLENNALRRAWAALKKRMAARVEATQEAVKS